MNMDSRIGLTLTNVYTFIVEICSPSSLIKAEYLYIHKYRFLYPVDLDKNSRFGMTI